MQGFNTYDHHRKPPMKKMLLIEDENMPMRFLTMRLSNFGWRNTKHFLSLKWPKVFLDFSFLKTHCFFFKSYHATCQTTQEFILLHFLLLKYLYEYLKEPSCRRQYVFVKDSFEIFAKFDMSKENNE